MRETKKGENEKNGEIKKMRKCEKEEKRKTATTWQGTIHGSVPETM